MRHPCHHNPHGKRKVAEAGGLPPGPADAEGRAVHAAARQGPGGGCSVGPLLWTR